VVLEDIMRFVPPATKDTGMDIIKHDYEITIHRKNMRDNIRTALNFKLASKVIIVADDNELDLCRRKAGELIDRYIDALEFRPISDFYIG
jgi:hypothetical protein